MRKINIFIVLLFLLFSCRIKNTNDSVIPNEEMLSVQAKDSNKQSVSLDISRTNSFYDELRNYYDEIELVYIEGEEYVDNHGKKILVLEKLEYYGIKSDAKYLLGYITSDGIFDKDSIPLKKLNISENIINLGLSSYTLEVPWGPSYVLQDLSWKNEIFNSEQFASLRIDFNTNSLVLYIPDYESP